MSLTEKNLDLLSKITVQLSLVELFIGSTVHGFKIPFGGNLLSLNQGIFLIRVTRISENRSEATRFPIYVSTVSGTLKSLSPAGNKLGPMLSISAQGFLFSSGIGLLGNNLAGQILGMIFLSSWALIQPFITFYFLYGSDLILAIQSGLKKLQTSIGVQIDYFYYALFVLIAVKIIIAIIIPIILQKKSNLQIDSTIAKINLEKFSVKKSKRFFGLKTKNVFLLSLQDLARPLFLFSLFLMLIFFIYSESSWVQIIWKMLRPIAISFLFIYLARSDYFKKLMLKMKEKKLFQNFFALLDRVTASIIKSES